MLRQFMPKVIKKLLTLLLIVPVLAIAQPKQKPGVTYDAQITRVIDGDTVTSHFDLSGIYQIV